MSDTVTVLQCLSPLRLTKKWTNDGTVASYDDAKNFHLTEHKVGSFRGMVKLLDALASRPNRAIIRGKWAGATLPGSDEKVHKNLQLFADQPHHWVMLDIDGFEPKTANPVTEPEAAVEEFIATQLPECFHGFSCRWQLSSSAGKPGSAHILKAHLTFWLTTPYGSGALKAWKLANNLPVDGALFNAVQFHFIADPVFEAGVVDPVPVRSGVIEGFGDEVDLAIPDSLLAQVKVREHTGDGVELPDPTEKRGVVGAFCRAFTIDQCLETFGDILPYEFESAGDERRINFLDGSGAPGGAFISDCRYYLSCKHNSDPFENRATNAFDLIRHYKFGDLDDADDAFDESATSSTSFHRMTEWAKTLPEVQAYLAAERAAVQQEEVATITDTGEDLLAELRTLTADEVRAQWVEKLLDAGPIAEDQAIGYLTGLLQTGRRPLQQALRQARVVREQHVREAARTVRLTDRTGNKTLIPYLPEATVMQAKTVEKLILDQCFFKDEVHEYLYFSGLLSHVVEQQLPKSHRIDDSEMAAPAVPAFRRMSRVAIRERAENVVIFTRATEGGPPAPVEVPSPILEALGDMGKPTAPQVSGLVTHPVVLQTGRILSAPGFDTTSGLLLWQTKVKDCRPYSLTEARAALDRIREDFLVGFEFESPLDEAIALAALFTAVERRAMDQAPAYLITASTQGTGKTTLARRIHLYLTGRDMPTVTYPKTAEEADKLLFTLLLAGPAMVCFDNVQDGFTFRSATLNQILTAPYFEQRLLGENKSARVPTDVFFTVTGNKVELGRDELTRFLEVKLTSKEERPDTRAFHVSDVVGHALGARDDVLRDVVGIVAGYRAAKVQATRASRFDAWDALVRQPLMWAGAADAAEGFDRNHVNSEDTIIENSLLSEMFRCFSTDPFQAADVLDRCDPFGDADKVLHRVLENASEHRGFRITRGILARHIGRLLQGLVGKRMTVSTVPMWLQSEKTRYGYEFQVRTFFDD